MEDLKFPDWSSIPQDPPKGMPMDKYLEFVLFMREAFPPKPGARHQEPAPVRFVIREDGDEYSAKKD